MATVNNPNFSIKIYEEKNKKMYYGPNDASCVAWAPFHLSLRCVFGRLQPNIYNERLLSINKYEENN